MAKGNDSAPRLVGIGGTTRPNSSTEKALRCVMEYAAGKGAETETFGGAFLAKLPFYDPTSPERTEEETQLVDAVRRADGLVFASPGYHGGVSGLVKNAIDLLEDTAKDTRVYFDGMPIGLIVGAAGWQATGSTLGAMRSIIHAMRGWPTPMGVTINSLQTTFDANGVCSDANVTAQLETLADQVLRGAYLVARSSR